MQRLEVSGAVRPIYGSLGVKRLTTMKDTIRKGFYDSVSLLLLFTSLWTLKSFPFFKKKINKKNAVWGTGAAPILKLNFRLTSPALGPTGNAILNHCAIHVTSASCLWF